MSITGQGRTGRSKSHRCDVELATHGMHATTRGCLAGSGVCFISHQGEVYPCGYLPVAAGDLKKERFRDVWEKSVVFAALRDPDRLQGKCGLCEFKAVCLGCRARAYGMTGNYLAEEPFCIYEPRRGTGLPARSPTSP